MKAEIGGFVTDLREAISVRTRFDRKYERFLFCGMGASLIGGTVLTGLMYYLSDLSAEVVRPAHMPKCAGDDTLVVVCSYSGNTRETLQMYKAARSRELDVVAVTWGGELERMAIEDGYPVVKISGPKIEPRSAIGWFLGLMSGIVEDAGGSRLRTDMGMIIPALEDYCRELESEHSEARTIAERIRGNIPVVYCAPDLEAASIRWKNQLNENAKIIAFAGMLPEFNHNEVVGWKEDSRRGEFLPIIIFSDVSTVVEETLDGTLDALERAGIEPLIINLEGSTLMEREMKAIILGDYVSIYLAELLGVDPKEVSTINRLKEVNSCRKDRAGSVRSPPSPGGSALSESISHIFSEVYLSKDLR